VIIGKLIPAATGLKRYRTIEISPSEPITRDFFPQQDETLLQALEEIGQDGLGELTFGGEPGTDGGTSHDAGEAEEIPEVDSPLDD
jgi:DNA-directed RNA polymerase subunit beta'